MKSQHSQLSLIIDDDDICSFILQLNLKNLNFCDESVILPSGFSACTYFDKALKNELKWPDYVFVDINMPVVDGFQVINKLLEIPKSLITKTKIYIITTRVKCSKVNALIDENLINGFLQKPIIEKNVLQIVNA